MSEAPSTCWTYLLLGRRPGDQRYEEAWRFLLGAYAPAIQRYFLRHAPDRVTAEEWRDEFLAAWLEGALDGAAPERGSFRRYLAVALRNFRYKALRQRQRRGWLGWGAAPAPEVAAGAEPDPFDRDFAAQVLSLALHRLRVWQAARRDEGAPSHAWDLVQARYLEGEPPPSLRDLAARFGLTEKAVERQLEKGRARLRDWILDELRETIADEGELAAEVAALREHGGPALAELAAGLLDA